MDKTVITTMHCNRNQRFRRVLLSISWVFGMLSGCIYGQSLRDLSIQAVNMSVFGLPTMIGSISAALLPFLLSALVVSIGEPWLLLFISAFKAFSFSFCAWGVYLTFGQSSWLVLFLFLFSDLCLIPVLYLYWLRHIRGEAAYIWEHLLMLVYVLMIAVLDQRITAPFLVSVLR